MSDENKNERKENKTIYSPEFIEKFGDWEKAKRLEKLRNASSLEKNDKVIVNGKDISDELTLLRESREGTAKLREFAKSIGRSVKGEYRNKDLNKDIFLSMTNIDEIKKHHINSYGHIEAMQYIPEIIKEGIFISEEPNTDKRKHPNIEKYKYLITGIKIGETDFTCKSAIAVDKDGKHYYDQRLSEIEKGLLLDNLSQLMSRGKSEQSLIEYDKRLLRICQCPQLEYLDKNSLEPTLETIAAVKNGTLYIEKDANGIQILHDTINDRHIGKEMSEMFIREQEPDKNINLSSENSPNLQTEPQIPQEANMENNHINEQVDSSNKIYDDDYVDPMESMEAFVNGTDEERAAMTKEFHEDTVRQNSANMDIRVLDSNNDLDQSVFINWFNENKSDDLKEIYDSNARAIMSHSTAWHEPYDADVIMVNGRMGIRTKFDDLRTDIDFMTPKQFVEEAHKTLSDRTKEYETEEKNYRSLSEENRENTHIRIMLQDKDVLEYDLGLIDENELLKRQRMGNLSFERDADGQYEQTAQFYDESQNDKSFGQTAAEFDAEYDVAAENVEMFERGIEPDLEKSDREIEKEEPSPIEEKATEKTESRNETLMDKVLEAAQAHEVEKAKEPSRQQDAEKKKPYHVQNTEKILAATKSGNAPWLPTAEQLSTAKENENIEIDPPPAVRGIKTGFAYAGENQLVGQLAVYEANRRDNALITYEQAKELGTFIKKGEKSVVLTTQDEKDPSKQKVYHAFPISSVADKSKVAPQLVNIASTYPPGAFRDEKIECHDSNPEKYLGAYLAASSTGAKFVTDIKTVRAFVTEFEKRIENGLQKNDTLVMKDIMKKANVNSKVEIKTLATKLGFPSQEQAVEKSQSAEKKTEKTVKRGDGGMSY